MGKADRQQVSNSGDLYQLVSQTADGDCESFNLLARQLTPIVYSRARAMLRNHAHAEDVVQLVLLKVWDHAARFDIERGSVLAWVNGLTRNTSVDQVRIEERVERNRLAAVSPPDRTYVNDIIELGFVQEAVRDALAALPSAQRESIELAFFGGLTYAEVAEKLGCPEGTVKSRIRRAMHSLSTELADESLIIDTRGRLPKPGSRQTVVFTGKVA